MEKKNEKIVKYYCPLCVVLDRHGGWDEDREELDSPEEYFEKIKRFVENYDDGDLASYFDGPMTNKLVSATWGVEIVNHTLYGCITVTLNAPLTAEEEQCLKDEITGQNSDGFGESLEQQGIKVDDGELYVSFWQHRKDYFLCNERELMKMLNLKQPYKFWHEATDRCQFLWKSSADREIVATLEFDNVDIELNFEDDNGDKVACLFACRNWENGGWESDTYVYSNVDMAIRSMKTWEEVEDFMYKALIMYCEEERIDYTKMLCEDSSRSDSAEIKPVTAETVSQTPNSTANVFEPGRMMTILRNALIAYEFELEGQGYGSQGAMHEVVRNEFGISEEEYRAIKGLPFEEIKLRQVSAEICDLFEELLDAHDITIPDEDRNGEEGEARIYGSTYSDLEDEITQILSALCHEVKTTPGAVINIEDY